MNMTLYVICRRLHMIIIVTMIIIILFIVKRATAIASVYLWRSFRPLSAISLHWCSYFRHGKTRKCPADQGRPHGHVWLSITIEDWGLHRKGRYTKWVRSLSSDPRYNAPALSETWSKNILRYNNNNNKLLLKQVGNKIYSIYMYLIYFNTFTSRSMHQKVWDLRQIG